MQCASCKREVDISGKVYFRDECPHCAADLHTCLNCEFYDPHASKQCRESNAEYVKGKDRANYCDYFRLSLGKTSAGSKADEAKKQLDALFKK